MPFPTKFWFWGEKNWLYYEFIRFGFIPYKSSADVKLDWCMLVLSFPNIVPIVPALWFWWDYGHPY